MRSPIKCQIPPKRDRGRSRLYLYIINSILKVNSQLSTSNMQKNRQKINRLPTWVLDTQVTWKPGFQVGRVMRNDVKNCAKNTAVFLLVLMWAFAPIGNYLMMKIGKRNQKSAFIADFRGSKRRALTQLITLFPLYSSGFSCQVPG